MSPAIAAFAVTVGGSLVFGTIVKATVVSAIALSMAGLVRHGSASLRHVIFATAFAVLLALPAAVLLLPARSLTVAVLPSVGVDGAVDRNPAPTAPVVSSTAEISGAGSLATRAWVSQGPIALVLWLVGVVVVGVPAAVSPIRVRRLRRDGLPWRHGQAIVDTIAAEQAVRAHVELLIHEDVAGPMTAGLIRPALMLPREAREWSTTALRHAIAHELAHIRRADWLTLCLARVACALYWFHPLVWMCWRQLRLEAERACDDAVLADAEPTDYADQLVALAERLVAHDTQHTLAMASRNDLAARIAAILDGSRPRDRAGYRWVAVAAAAAALLTIGIAPLRAVAAPQTASNGRRLSFEAASIKPNTTGSQNSGSRGAPDGSVQVTNMSVMDLIAWSFAVRDSEVIGAPDWLRTSQYDIAARAPQGATPQQTTQMIQSLLEDRFQLRVHREARAMPVYRLRVAQGGPRFLPAKEGSCRTEPATSPGEVVRSCGYNMLSPGTFDMVMAPMTKLVAALGGLSGRRVIDETGLTGAYSLHLDFAAEQARDDVRPSVFTAVQEQLGLRLESSTGPVEVLMIDRVERPTAN